MASAARKGTNFMPFFARRLFILLLFGVVHALFFSYFDILVVYALLGYVLLFLRDAPLRVLLILAVFCLAIPFGFRAIGGIDTEALGLLSYSNAERLEIYGAGGFGTIFMARLHDLAEYYVSVLEVSGGKVFALFLVGAVVGRLGVFQRPAEFQRWIRLAFWGGTVVGLIGAVGYVTTTLLDFSFESGLLNLGMRGFFAFSDLGLVSMYCMGMLLLAQQPGWPDRLEPLASVGRMALTNYILQSVICTTLFYGYGFGLFGTLQPAGLLLLAVVIYLGQIAFSTAWLRAFRMGPLEWLWRVLTYGKTTPLRRTAAA
ncbi:MAG: DUF418 domain-containing protein [Blastochloris sp.]|nr:DUF418 domain-containing protein [Blastochloris sp.]